MSRIALVAPIALAVLAFAGCQSDEEKLKERAALKAELISEIKSELTYTIQMEAEGAVKRAIEEHKRKLQEEQAKAATAKAAPTPVAPGAAKSTTPAKPSTKKK